VHGWQHVWFDPCWQHTPPSVMAQSITATIALPPPVLLEIAPKTWRDTVRPLTKPGRRIWP